MKNSAKILLLIGCAGLLWTPVAGLEEILPVRGGARWRGALPETVLKYGDVTMGRDEAIVIFDRTPAGKLDLSRSEFLDALRKALDEELCYAMVERLLKKNNIVPSQQRAYDYLTQSAGKLPDAVKKLATPEEKFSEYASGKEFQITIALQEYFKLKQPEKIAVSDADIEFFYRANQNLFTRDAKMEIGVIAVDRKLPGAHVKITAAQDRLKQGEDFDRIADEYNRNLPPEWFGGGLPAELLRVAITLDPGMDSGIVELPDRYGIVRLKSKKAPEYIPLSDCTFFIRSTLEGRKCAKELQRILEENMRLLDVEYYF